MKIKLGSKGYTIIDDEDFGKVNFCNWYLYKDTHNEYAVNKDHVRMHRVIMDASEEQTVDHKDGNGLNNQRSNLRLCTQAQNLCNKKVIKKTVSKFLGVCKNRKSWVATCRKDGILHRVYTKSEEDAAKEYNLMASKYHGDFARLNII